MPQDSNDVLAYEYDEIKGPAIQEHSAGSGFGASSSGWLAKATAT